MSTLEDMKRNHPKALCWQGSDCKELDHKYYPRGPCVHWKTKFPCTFCRIGYGIDKRIKPELKE